MTEQERIWNKLAITILLTGLGFLSSAQRTGSVSGFVANNQSRLEFAEVYLTASEDSTKILDGTVTDSTGHFIISNLPYGNYFLNVRLIGTIQKQLRLVISPSISDIDLGEIELETDTHVLNTVEVTALRSIIQKFGATFRESLMENRFKND